MKKKILEKLETAWAGKTCLCFDTLESTNDTAKELAKQEAVHGTLIVADAQTAGRGRRGRSWECQPGDSIAMSLCLEPKFAPEKAAGLTLVMALAVADAVRTVTGMEPQIKWPNDIVLHRKKVCGILTELIFTKSGYSVIIGTGINVNMREFPEEIREIAGSLRSVCGRRFEREQLIAEIMKHFETCYDLYSSAEDFSLLRDRYEMFLANKDCEVRVLDPAGAYEGIAKGINDAGNLRVVCVDGTEKEIDSGEVSVRGLYGYV